MLTVYIIGRVKVPLEEKLTASGKKYVKLGLSADVLKRGQRESRLVSCFFWDSRFEKIYPFIKKDVPLCVVGGLDVSSYLSREGEPKSQMSVNVHMVSFLPKPIVREEKSIVDSYTEEMFDKRDKEVKEVEWEEGLF